MDYKPGSKTVSIAWTTPLEACTSVTTIVLTLPLASVSVALEASTSIAPPKVVTVPVVRSSALTLAPFTTCNESAAASTLVSRSPKPEISSSANRSAKASLVGAKTVKVPAEVSVFTKEKEASAVSAVSNCVKVGSATAKVATVGNAITASTVCTIPLENSKSVAVTLAPPSSSEPPLIVTTSLSTLMYILRFALNLLPEHQQRQFRPN